MFVFAVGLAMAAWASLMKDSGRMRLMFVVIACAALFVGSVLYLQIFGDVLNVLL